MKINYMFDMIQQVDFKILNFINGKLSSSPLDKLMPFISSLADNGFIWIISSLLLLSRKKERKSGLTLLIALIIEVIVCNVIIKPLVHRARPYDLNDSVRLLISPLSDYSFPSAHTAASFAAAVVLYYADKRWGMCAYTLATAIGFSRLYLYVHFPSDVLAGVLFGILSGTAAIAIINRF